MSSSQAGRRPVDELPDLDLSEFDETVTDVYAPTEEEMADAEAFKAEHNASILPIDPITDAAKPQRRRKHIHIHLGDQ